MTRTVTRVTTQRSPSVTAVTVLVAIASSGLSLLLLTSPVSFCYRATSSWQGISEISAEDLPVRRIRGVAIPSGACQRAKLLSFEIRDPTTVTATPLPEGFALESHWRLEIKIFKGLRLRFSPRFPLPLFPSGKSRREIERKEQKEREREREDFGFRRR